jgi:GT2 family glycosyltransferase
MIHFSPVTFCIGTSNNLNYLKLAIQSVRSYSYYKDAPFIIFAENCTDGTDEWLQQNKDTYNLEIYIEHNDEDSRKGIGMGMNFCADKVQTEYIMFLHADFVVSENWDKRCEEVFEQNPDKKLWVSSYRIQPNIFNEPSRPGTFIVPNDEFGEFYHNFDMQHFIKVAKEFSELNHDIVVRKGEGVSGLVRKRDWDEIGGNDPLFTPLAFDDMDLFIRMQLAGFEFPLIGSSVVYHFGSRSDNGHFMNDEMQRATKQINYEQRSAQRFFEKWGQMPQHDEVGFVKPIYR